MPGWMTPLHSRNALSPQQQTMLQSVVAYIGYHELTDADVELEIEDEEEEAKDVKKEPGTSESDVAMPPSGVCLECPVGCVWVRPLPCFLPFGNASPSPCKFLDPQTCHTRPRPCHHTKPAAIHAQKSQSRLHFDVQMEVSLQKSGVHMPQCRQAAAWYFCGHGIDHKLHTSHTSLEGSNHALADIIQRVGVERLCCVVRSSKPLLLLVVVLRLPMFQDKGSYELHFLTTCTL